MTAALEGGEWSAARSGRTLPPGKTQYPLYRRLGEPQGRSGRPENLVPTGIWSRTVQLVAQSLYRLSYPAHLLSCNAVYFGICTPRLRCNLLTPSQDCTKKRQQNPPKYLHLTRKLQGGGSHLKTNVFLTCWSENLQFYNSKHRQLCRSLPNYSQRITNKMQRFTVYLFLRDAVHVSDGFSVSHQEHKTEHTASGICQTVMT